MYMRANFAPMFMTATLGVAYILPQVNLLMVPPLLSFMRSELSMSDVESAIILSAFPIVALPSNLLAGFLSDRIGRRRFLFWGALACAVTFLLTAAARDAAWIAAFRAILGVFMPMVGASIFSAVSDYFEPSARTKVTGYVHAIGSMSQLVALPACVFLAEAVGWRAVFVALALYSAALAVAIILQARPQYGVIAKESMTPRAYANQMVSLMTKASSRYLLIGYFLHTISVFAFLSLYPTWLVEHWNVSGYWVGTIFLLGGITALLGSVGASRVSSLFESPLMLCVLFVALTVGALLPIPDAGNLLGVQMRSMFFVIFISSAMLSVEATRRGSLNGLLNAIFQSGAALGGICGAWAYSRQETFHLNSEVSIALLVATAISLYKASKVSPPELSPTPAQRN
jgi:MFS transporter, DHA1 family, multidrug resistance protein